MILRKRPSNKAPEYNSSDEGEFRHSRDAPDPDEESYFDDDVDTFHKSREKVGVLCSLNAKSESHILCSD